MYIYIKLLYIYANDIRLKLWRKNSVSCPSKSFIAPVDNTGLQGDIKHGIHIDVFIKHCLALDGIILSAHIQDQIAMVALNGIISL